MPDNQAREKYEFLEAMGVEVRKVPAVPFSNPNHFFHSARALAEEHGWFWANQFENTANGDFHYETTGPELWEQTEGRITHFVAAAGTGGTLTGVGRYLKERNPDVQIVCGDPHGSILAELWRSKGQHKIEGTPYKIEGIGQDKLPGTLDLGVVDEYHTVSDKDSFAMARRLTREEGLFVGGSAGLITHVALELARRVDDPDALVVTFLCDTGERYLSKLYNDEWMRENQLLEADRAPIAVLLQRRDPAAPALVSTAPGALVRQALGLMRLHDVSQLPVMEGDRCVGSVTEYALTTRSLESTRILDATVGEVMDDPFPLVDASQPVESITKLLSKASPAVLINEGGRIAGIVTRTDVLQFLMTR
jgi:cystathionine beta-synthase